LSVMRPICAVGIVGFGAYVPEYRLKGAEVSRVWTHGVGEASIDEKAVAGPDEDTATISIVAARDALRRAGIAPEALRAVWIGSESHPYAVKPTATMVAEAIGAGPHILAADLQFACKAGTEGLQAAIALVGSGMAKYAMAIGADTAQGRPGDVLEYYTGSGGAAYIIGSAEESLAVLEGSYSYVTDTPDFWRRQGQRYPRHGGRFTGEPAYFHHLETATRRLMDDLDLSADDVDWVVFHQPNPTFPLRAAADLGLSRDKLRPGLLVNSIGNTYAGSSMIGLAATLDVAEPGQRILQCSFGSGAGSDAFSWLVTERLEERRAMATDTRTYLARRRVIDYATYARYRGKLHTS